MQNELREFLVEKLLNGGFDILKFSLKDLIEEMGLPITNFGGEAQKITKELRKLGYLKFHTSKGIVWRLQNTDDLTPKVCDDSILKNLKDISITSVVIDDLGLLFDRFSITHLAQLTKIKYHTLRNYKLKNFENMPLELIYKFEKAKLINPASLLLFRLDTLGEENERE